MQNLPFNEAKPYLEAGHDIITELAGGKIRTLRMVAPGACDCNFVGDAPMIVTIKENPCDQDLGLWISVKEDTEVNRWDILPKNNN